MAYDAKGYLRPVQSHALEADEERQIEAICPGLGQTVEAGDRIDDDVWGPYLQMKTGWATDPALRDHASSGGALTALLLHLMRTGQVDGVIQTHASDSNPLGNQTTLSRSEDAVIAAAGSRYAPSAPLAALAEHLETPGRFAFVGKPCDVAALRALMREDPRIAEKTPVLVSFFCGGIPSSQGAEGILSALGVTLPEVQAFRYRGDGWPGKATATLHDGDRRQMSYAESWGNILSHHVQHRCKICPDGAGMAADFVCADAWTADEKGYPVFEEGDGVSLIVARTALGAEIIAGAEEARVIESAPFDVAGLTAIQPGQFWRRRVVLARLTALRLLGRPAPRYAGLHLWAMLRRSSLREAGTNFLGMIRRVAQGRV